MPLYITEKTTDPATTVYAASGGDTATYLDPPSTGTYVTYSIKYAPGTTLDTDIIYQIDGAGKRKVVGTRPRGSGH